MNVQARLESVTYYLWRGTDLESGEYIPGVGAITFLSDSVPSYAASNWTGFWGTRSLAATISIEAVGRDYRLRFVTPGNSSFSYSILGFGVLTRHDGTLFSDIMNESATAVIELEYNPRTGGKLTIAHDYEVGWVFDGVEYYGVGADYNFALVRPVPIPASGVLLACGLATLLLRRRHRQR
ncbi:hypothetical protein GCM10017056_46320 [Seohaeicola zhoushanensis]|uniref:Uncharacterized protein n=1 Tax=Seohaeicola zhoushanensis TaxID=1569283 RepID=A0A8J3H0Y9_9RHOB|nr:hypothetical protein GCM10017056_46320 [Seohaeicola zhoushanensis]